MAEQRRSGPQRSSSADKSAASKPARKPRTTKAASKAAASGSQGSGSGAGGSSGSGGASARGGRSGGRSSSRREGQSGRDAVLQAREQVSELMGRPVESVLGMERDEDGWLITVQLVELARIPSSTDVLGDYAVRVDDDGEVIGYRRTRRYYRSQADGA